MKKHLPYQNTRQALITFLTLVLLIVSTNAYAARASDKWRLHFNGKAKNDGVITLQFSPLGSQASQIEIEIKDNTRENEASREATDILREKLDEDYKINHQDGEEIKIKARSGRAEFVLEVISNTIKGLDVKTDRE